MCKLDEDDHLKSGGLKGNYRGLANSFGVHRFCFNIPVINIRFHPWV